MEKKFNLKCYTARTELLTREKSAVPKVLLKLQQKSFTVIIGKIKMKKTKKDKS